MSETLSELPFGRLQWPLPGLVRLQQCRRVATQRLGKRGGHRHALPNDAGLRMARRRPALTSRRCSIYQAGIRAAIERQEQALRSKREPEQEFADGQALREQLRAQAARAGRRRRAASTTVPRGAWRIRRENDFAEQATLTRIAVGRPTSP